MIVKVMLLFMLAIIVTLSSCKKEEDQVQVLEGSIILTTSNEYPLGVVNKWNVLSSATSYNLYRSNDSENYDIINSLASNVTTYFDTSAVEGIQYQYYVVGTSSNIDGSVKSNTTTGLAVSLTTENSFALLANLTGGYYSTTPSADSLTDVIIALIDSFATEGADVMFLIDKTGSMMDDIMAVQSGLTSIIAALPSNCRLGLASYGDLIADSVWGSGGNDWYDFEDLTLNHSNIQALVNSLSTTGGGDFPESVFDGLYRTIGNASWQAGNKLLIVIGDAPPLITPCNLPLTPAQPVECTMHTIMDVVNACLANSVVTNLYPVVIGPIKTGNTN
tara:strand:- start:118 stop:1116 length:999 start_codon:yes stop_codon:yes gene_type:complete